MAKRSYGTGSLFLRSDGRRPSIWYGKWWIGDRQVKRRIGLARKPGGREGLTRAQAERELRRRMEVELPTLAPGRVARSRAPASA